MKDLHAVIKAMRLTEKGTRLTESENQYFFKVDPRATKPEIKRAVETLFKVSVVKVNTMNLEGKMRRERFARYGRKPDWKKAVVTLKEGDKIELQ